jgi:hypothetical protein
MNAETRIRETRVIERSTDGGKTWSECVVRNRSLMWNVGSVPVTDNFGNWYRALGSSVPVGGVKP